MERPATATRPPPLVEGIWMLSGCTLCGLCASIAPDVFDLDDAASRVKPGSRPLWRTLSEDILAAEQLCPADIIRVQIARPDARERHHAS